MSETDNFLVQRIRELGRNNARLRLENEALKNALDEANGKAEMYYELNGHHFQDLFQKQCDQLRQLGELQVLMIEALKTEIARVTKERDDAIDVAIKLTGPDQPLSEADEKLAQQVVEDLPPSTEELVELIAQIIWDYWGGFYPEEHEAIFGTKKKLWKTDAPWDTNPDELAEHERDEYRLQARKVIEFLQNKKIL